MSDGKHGEPVRTVTVLFADLVEATAPFSGWGETTVDSERERPFRLLRRALQRNGAQEVESLADGLLALFGSATDGVRCAVDIQQSIKCHNLRRRCDPLHVRVGLSLGELTVRAGDDHHGRPIAEARHLCAAAAAGEVLAIDAVRTLVGNSIERAIESLGTWELSGLPEPLRVARVVWDPQPSRLLRVVLADDAALVREGIARLLAEEGFEVVAQASDAEALFRCVQALRPDVVITDVRMPPSYSLEGLEAAERIRAELPGVAVMLLSQHLESEYARRLTAGGRQGIGYLLKERVTDVGQFARLVRRVADSGTAIDPDPAGRHRRPEGARGAGSRPRGWVRATAAALRRGLLDRRLARQPLPRQGQQGVAPSRAAAGGAGD